MGLQVGVSFQGTVPIDAIKLYRQLTGAGLKEAKAVIDGMR